MPSVSSVGGIPPFSQPSPNKVTKKQKADALATLFGYAPLAQYWWLFVLHTISYTQWSESTADALHHNDVDIPWPPYVGYNKIPKFNVRYVSGLDNAKAFKGVAGGQSNEVFASLAADYAPASPILVPYPMAAVLSSAFIKGLATRLVLGKYASNWATIRSATIALKVDLSEAGQGGVDPGKSADNLVAGYLTSYSKKMIDPKSWDDTYQNCLINLTDASLQVVGILMGWRVGDMLTKKGAPQAAQDCLNSFWLLFGSKYTRTDLGAMSGYVFEYLIGDLECERTQKIISQKKDDGADNTSGGIYKKFSEHSRGRADQEEGGSNTNVSSQFYGFIVQELFTLSQSQGSSAALADYGAYIYGFIHGVSKAADVLFSDIYLAGYKDGYTVGYSNGFATGYAQGYAAGYQVGYASGVGDAQSTWSGVQNIIGGLNGVLSNIGQVQNILSDAATVGTVIASVF